MKFFYESLIIIFVVVHMKELFYIRLNKKIKI